jgi:hypothetical protein
MGTTNNATPTVTHSRVHHALLSGIIERGHAPKTNELAATLGFELAEIKLALEGLAELHGLVLQPGSYEVWVVHPFSLSPTTVWVSTQQKGWWAPCLWCALGVAALVCTDVEIHTRLAGEADPLTISVANGHITAGKDLIVHFPIRPRDAWTNVIHFCATVQPFRNGPQVNEWCSRHAITQGAVVPITQVNELARRWYGSHLDVEWKKWSTAEAKQIFTAAGLLGDFWSLDGMAERF